MNTQHHFLLHIPLLFSLYNHTQLRTYHPPPLFSFFFLPLSIPSFPPLFLLSSSFPFLLSLCSFSYSPSPPNLTYLPTLHLTTPPLLLRAVLSCPSLSSTNSFFPLFDLPTCQVHLASRSPLSPSFLHPSSLPYLPYPSFLTAFLSFSPPSSLLPLSSLNISSSISSPPQMSVLGRQFPPSRTPTSPPPVPYPYTLALSFPLHHYLSIFVFVLFLGLH